MADEFQTGTIGQMTFQTDEIDALVLQNLSGLQQGFDKAWRIGQEGEFIARQGGDEFLALASVANRDEALAVAERLREAAIQTVTIEHADLS